ncbi:c-type cytochrome [Achromobacter marplatensis]|uniref:c-type cytochrome n=1 Tax=Achromobacter marplatensis TaxID=470868 RepID=UPI0039F64CCE
MFARVRLNALALLCASLIASVPACVQHGALPPSTIDNERVQLLIHLVRQDCGACHGLNLTGGLGPALTPTALGGKHRDYLSRIILQGVPGTAMPAWQPLLDPVDADWIARRLLEGFPPLQGALP